MYNGLVKLNDGIFKVYKVIMMILLALIRDFRNVFTMRAGAAGIALLLLLVHSYFTAGVLRRPNASFYVSMVLAMAYYLINLKKEADVS